MLTLLSIRSNLGAALVVNNTSNVLVESSFTYNQCRCKSFSEMSELGCGVIAISSTLTFTSFHQAAYSFYCGGAIWVSASSLHFNGTNNFIFNSTNGTKRFGGAIYVNSDTTMSFTETSSDFSNSSAENNAGAIGAYDHLVLTFNLNQHPHQQISNQY